jgi:altronate hydrolase
MTRAIVVSASDNVATALEPLAAGSSLAIAGATIAVRDRIPQGHKIAIQDIGAGAAVVKYGSPIGTATTDIARGAHVHTHNVASTRGRGDLAAASGFPSEPGR